MNTEEMVREAGVPTPEEIRNARIELGLTLRESAELIHITLRGWQSYERGERRMHPAFWELFTLKTKRLKPKS